MKYLQPNEIKKDKIYTTYPLDTFTVLLKPTGEPIVTFCYEESNGINLPQVAIQFGSLQELNDFCVLVEKKIWEQEHQEV
jgi:hypothetical protein